MVDYSKLSVNTLNDRANYEASQRKARYEEVMTRIKRKEDVNEYKDKLAERMKATPEDDNSGKDMAELLRRIYDGHSVDTDI